MNYLHSFDQTIMSAVYSLRNPILTRELVAFTSLGGNTLIAILALVAIVLLAKRYYAELFFLVATTAGGHLLNMLIKLLVARPRPSLALVQEAAYSFPSGHSMDSMIGYTVLALGVWYFTRNKNLTIAAFVFATILILSVGFSRIYLGVHYPTDVLGGYVIGLIWVTSCISTWKRFIARRQAKA